MKLRCFIFVFAAGLISAPTGWSAPAPSDAKGAFDPTIVAQAKSLAELLNAAKAMAKKTFPEEFYRQFETELQSKIDFNAIKGVDVSKPLGLYANIDAGLKDGDFTKSGLVLLIPVTEEKDFLATLAKAQLKAEKNGDEHAIQIPGLPVEAALRFSKGYAYVSVGQKLDSKSLPDSATIIDASEPAAVMVKVRINRIPVELKEIMLQLFAQASDAVAALPQPADAKELTQDYIKWWLNWTKIAFSDGKDLIYRVDLVPSHGVFAAEWSISGKADSGLAKSIKTFKPTKNDFTEIIGDDSAASLLVQTPLFIGELRESLTKLASIAEGEAFKELGNDAPVEVKNLVKEGFSALARTLKSENLDLAASLRGPDKNEQFSVIGAFSVRDTAPLEKAIKAAVKSFPKKLDEVALDVFQVAGVNVHELRIAALLEPPVQKIFGKSNVYVALAPDAVFIAFGPLAKDFIKDALGKKHVPKPAALVQIESSGKRLVTLIKNAGAPTEGPAGEFLSKLRQIEKMPVLTVKVEGGDRLVVRTEISLLPMLGLVPVRSASAVAPAAPKAIAPPPPMKK